MKRNRLKLAILALVSSAVPSFACDYGHRLHRGSDGWAAIAPGATVHRRRALQRHRNWRDSSPLMWKISSGTFTITAAITPVQAIYVGRRCQGRCRDGARFGRIFPDGGTPGQPRMETRHSFRQAKRCTKREAPRAISCLASHATARMRRASEISPVWRASHTHT